MATRASAKIYWKDNDLEQITEKMEHWVKLVIDEQTFNSAEEIAGDIVQWMQDNAPWQDQTGDARAKLTVEVQRNPKSIELIISHGVEYGIFLELMQNGQFSILAKTVNYWAPKMPGLLAERRK